MCEKLNETTKRIMEKRFGHNCLIAVATMNGDRPDVRVVNAFYKDGAFYSVTYALSGKMKQLEKNPSAAVCGEWFSGHGIGENLGYICADKNAELADELRKVFYEWYDNGHTDESDPNTCILRIQLTDGVILNNGIRYEIDFAAG